MADRREYTFEDIERKAKYILPLDTSTLIYFGEDDYIGIDGRAIFADFVKYLTDKEPTDIIPDFYNLKQAALERTEDGCWRIFREVEISTALEVAQGQPIIKVNATAKALNKE